VSAFIDSHRDTLPVEFRLLRYSPRPWTAIDTLATGKLLSLDLASGWEGEAFRAVVGDRLPLQVQDLLFPTTFPDDRILVGSDTAPPAAGAAAATEPACCRPRGARSIIGCGRPGTVRSSPCGDGSMPCAGPPSTIRPTCRRSS